MKNEVYYKRFINNNVYSWAVGLKTPGTNLIEHIEDLPLHHPDLQELRKLNTKARTQTIDYKKLRGIK